MKVNDNICKYDTNKAGHFIKKIIIDLRIAPIFFITHGIKALHIR